METNPDYLEYIGPAKETWACHDCHQARCSGVYQLTLWQAPLCDDCWIERHWKTVTCD